MDGQWWSSGRTESRWSQSPLSESRLCLETASFSTEADKKSYSVSADVRTSACDSPRGQTLQTHCDIIQPHDCSPPCCCCCVGAAAQLCFPQFFLPLLMITSPLTWWSITSDWWKLKWLHTKAQLLLLFQSSRQLHFVHWFIVQHVCGIRQMVSGQERCPNILNASRQEQHWASSVQTKSALPCQNWGPGSRLLQIYSQRSRDVQKMWRITSGRRPLKRLYKQPPASTCSSKSKPMTETTDHLPI